MKSIVMLNAVVCGLVAVVSGAAAAEPDGSSPKDFAYCMRVKGMTDAAAYRVTLPLSLYQTIVYPDLSDVRVFNASGELVPFALERAAAGTVANAAVALPLFPLRVDSSETPDSLRVTIESGKSAINVQAGSQNPRGDRIATYLVDGRSLAEPVAALRLEWGDSSADFAGRMQVEASENLADWRTVAGAAPVANLHASTQRLVEQRLEFAPNKARYWRLSWVGTSAPFVLTSVFAEPARQSVDATRVSLTVSTDASAKSAPGDFEYELHARAPIDRVNLELPETNTVADVELLSRPRVADPWRNVRNAGFYRLNSDGRELRNALVPVQVDTDSHWIVRTDPRGGGIGKVAPRLTVEWVPHDIVFVARGSAPFFIAYGSVAVDTSAAVTLSLLPKNLSIATAALSDPERLGGEVRLTPPAPPYAWRAALLWIVLIAAAGLLAWMAYRLSRDVERA